jgi:hypothetical protein
MQYPFRTLNSLKAGKSLTLIASECTLDWDKMSRQVLGWVFLSRRKLNHSDNSVRSRQSTEFCPNDRLTCGKVRGLRFTVGGDVAGDSLAGAN